ncbi:hypothetical protein [Magnetofaba australis]|uniref:hypothetical protein n=1 Tax=Magnetofaba australis TaxID=1472297 RepID=UPI0011809C23|nr:hypothetical protein [Magnetofaba australis]
MIKPSQPQTQTADAFAQSAEERAIIDALLQEIGDAPAAAETEPGNVSASGQESQSAPPPLTEQDGEASQTLSEPVKAGATEAVAQSVDSGVIDAPKEAQAQTSTPLRMDEPVAEGETTTAVMASANVAQSHERPAPTSVAEQPADASLTTHNPPKMESSAHTQPKERVEQVVAASAEAPVSGGNSLLMFVLMASVAVMFLFTQQGGVLRRRAWILWRRRYRPHLRASWGGYGEYTPAGEAPPDPPTFLANERRRRWSDRVARHQEAAPPASVESDGAPSMAQTGQVPSEAVSPSVSANAPRLATRETDSAAAPEPAAVTSAESDAVSSPEPSGHVHREDAFPHHHNPYFLTPPCGENGAVKMHH